MKGAPASASIEQAITTLAETPVRDIQDHGYHFQKRDFYSALNDLPFLSENSDLWHDRPPPRGIRWDLDAQLDNVRLLSQYFGELVGIPLKAQSSSPRFHWENDFWRGADALMQYGMLRHHKPRRVIEIGAGWSSLLMAEALRRNLQEGAPPAVVDQIEPYPRSELLSALPSDWTLHSSILQRADLCLFDSLEPGDVCFYDGSHVARAGSDVVWFFFEVLPRLRPGVLVHVHDIFWPDDYPDDWIFTRGQTWNEQYLLQAFLMYNNAFEVQICNSMLFNFRRDVLKALCLVTAETLYSGCSVWLVSTEGSAAKTIRSS